MGWQAGDTTSAELSGEAGLVCAELGKLIRQSAHSDEVGR
jgi:hypothetical protein